MSNAAERFFDIYLWKFPESDKLIKISHLTYEEATRLSTKWVTLNNLHDYMLVFEGSMPFIDKPSITVQTKEWLESVDSAEQL